MNDLTHWLMLTIPLKLDGHQVQQLLDRVDHAVENIFSNLGKLAAAFNLSKEFLEKLQNPNTAEIKKTLQWLEKSDHHFIHWQHKDYPTILRHIANPPSALYVKGDPAILNKTHFAMVGSRYPSPHGIEIAETFAAELAQKKLIICSGLALGIDAASHRGALTGGLTTAVLGNGLADIYPTRHRALAEEIVEKGGAIVSELPLSTQPQKAFFPLRNRIISGLSIGALVVEAALQSGSLVTARSAGEQGREVFAIPGSLFNPLSKGSHKLIQQGAKLVTTVDDILQEFPKLFVKDLKKNKNAGIQDETILLEKTIKRLLECVAFAPTSVDRITTQMGERAEKIAEKLLQLELSGYIQRVPGGYVRVRREHEHDR